jgi:hypothetical protein
MQQDTPSSPIKFDIMLERFKQLSTYIGKKIFSKNFSETEPFMKNKQGSICQVAENLEQPYQELHSSLETRQASFIKPLMAEYQSHVSCIGVGTWQELNPCRPSQMTGHSFRLRLDRQLALLTSQQRQAFCLAQLR